MGLDGGTRATRTDVLRRQSWRLATRDNSRSTRGGSVSTSETLEEKRLEKDAERKIKWTTCALSEQTLEAPVMADCLGNLYNRMAVLTFLLNRKGVFEDEGERHFYANVLQSHGQQFRHLQKRKDVFELKTVSDVDWSVGLVTCSISGMDALRTPFSALASCGHVFSDRAIAEMNDGQCMECSKPFQDTDVVHLNCENESLRKEMEQNLKEPKRARDRRASSGKRKIVEASKATPNKQRRQTQTSPQDPQ